MAQFRSFLDKVMQTNGNGVLGTVSSITTSGLPSGVAAQFGMAKPPGAQLVYYNQTIQVYDPTLTTNRGSANILLVDPFNSLIQVDSLPQRHQRERLDRPRRAHRRAARVAVRHFVSPDQRDHRHVAQPQPRHVPGGTCHAQREREQLGAHAGSGAPCDQ